MRPRRTRRSGITTFEVIVTLFLIFLLMSLLFPAFQEALGRAHMATCLGHEKEIANAMALYLTDSDDTYPPIVLEEGKTSWKDLIFDYTKGMEDFRCPSNPSHLSPDAFGRLPTSYGFNSCASTWTPIYSEDGRSANPVGRTVVHDSSLQRPADTIMVGEVTYGTLDVNPSWAYNQISCDPQGFFEHLRYPNPPGKYGQANFVFFDGHVHSRSYLETLQPLRTNNWLIGDVDPDIRVVDDSSAPNCTYPASPPVCGY